MCLKESGRGEAVVISTSTLACPGLAPEAVSLSMQIGLPMQLASFERPVTVLQARFKLGNFIHNGIDFCSSLET